MKTKKNRSIKKFIKFYQSLNGDEQRNLYDVLCMLRGPDIPHSDLKNETTARIRFILKVHEHKKEGSPLAFLSINNSPFPYDIEEKIKSLGSRNIHFLSHFIRAIQSLEDEGIIIKKE